MNDSSMNKSKDSFPDSVGRYGNMLEDYYIQAFHRSLLKRSRKLSALTSRAEAAEYVQTTKLKLQRIFDPFPTRMPLCSRISGQINTDSLLADKVVFESQPGLVVPGLFWRRRGATGRIPGLLFIPGHSQEGKAYEQYQRCAQFFALNGYGVFIFDPLGQGERHEGIPATDCHTQRGLQLLMAGEKICTWMLWEAIRALDYLASRPEIDTARLGVTGTSGGGNMTMLLSAFDDRLSFSIPSCFRNSHLRVLENEQTGDLEQHMPGMVGQGLEMADFLIAAAPRRTLLLGQDQDFFDLRGLKMAFQETAKIYQYLGHQERLQIFIGKGKHGYDWEGCQKMAEFLGISGTHQDEIHVFKASKLDCLPEKTDSQTAIGYAWEKALQAPLGYSPTQFKLALRQELALGQIPLPDYRQGSVQTFSETPRLYLSRFRVATETGIRITLKQIGFEPRTTLKAKPNVILLVAGYDSSRELHDLDWQRYPDSDVFTIEARGIGESKPAEINFSPARTELHFAAAGYDLGKPFLGRQIYDILATVKLLQSVGAEKIVLIANTYSTISTELAGILGSLPVQTQSAKAFSIQSALLEQSPPPFSMLFPHFLQYAKYIQDHPNIYVK